MTTDKNNVAHETFLNATYECDERYLADTAFCFRIIQECAALHGKLKGVSIPDMACINRTWVILRSIIDVKKYPSWSRKVDVDTWVSFEKGYFGPRGFHAVNDDGSEFFTARTLWAVLDKTTRVPVKLADISEKLGPCLIDDDFHALPRTLKPDMSFMTEKPVMKRFVPSAHYGDTDINGHINNVVYYNWMIQALDDGFLSSYKPVHVDIAWLHEVHKSDSIEVCVHDIGEDSSGVVTYGFSIDRLSPDGTRQCCCAAIIGFASFD